jgi:hypothetical protein
MKFFGVVFTLLFLPQFLQAQTRADSLAGKYTRNTWEGEGMHWINSGNGQSAVGYATSATVETLVLDKNHCAALTVNVTSVNCPLCNNPVVYYGIWKISGDTMTITYSKTYSFSNLVYSDSSQTNVPDALIKLDPPMIAKFFVDSNDNMLDDIALLPLTGELSRTGYFYKEVKNPIE